MEVVRERSLKGRMENGEEDYQCNPGKKVKGSLMQGKDNTDVRESYLKENTQNYFVK